MTLRKKRPTLQPSRQAGDRYRDGFESGKRRVAARSNPA
jgi:hypothetical protein